MTYTIWMCCGHFEQEDTREEAIGMAAACMNGDGHSVWAVEGPNGEDLMDEAKEHARQQTQRWVERNRDSETRLLGHIEVMGPTGKWSGREAFYNAQSRDTELAAYRATYGEDRVRWVEKT